MLEFLKPICNFATKNVPAVLLLVVLLFLLPDIGVFQEVIRMRDEYTGYIVFIGLFCLCILICHWIHLGWEAFQRRKQRIALEEKERKAAQLQWDKAEHEAQLQRDNAEHKARLQRANAEYEAKLQREKEEREAARIRAEEQARIDREVVLFSRLSIEERRMLLQWYAGREKNQYADMQCPSISKLQERGYIEMVAFNTYCLSDSTCDLFDARLDELKSHVSGEEGLSEATKSSKDMHPDAVIARKYAEGDPETIRKLSIFDP